MPAWRSVCCEEENLSLRKSQALAWMECITVLLGSPENCCWKKMRNEPQGRWGLRCQLQRFSLSWKGDPAAFPPKGLLLVCVVSFCRIWPRRQDDLAGEGALIHCIQLPCWQLHHSLCGPGASWGFGSKGGCRMHVSCHVSPGCVLRLPATFCLLLWGQAL